MARKIIPLKYIGTKNQKGSPFKESGAWTMIKRTHDPLNIFGTYERPETDEDRRVGEIEEEFGTLKQGLMDIDVSENFYKDLANPYAGLEDPFASLEDFSEDLTVNTRARQQEERLLQRGLSQTLQSTKQTGTQSAQAIANQLAQSSGDIAAKTAAEEYEIGKIQAKSKQELGLRKAASKRETEMMVRKGAFDVGMQKIKGREESLSRRLNKQQALLGLVSGELARADAAKEAEKGFLGINWSW